MKKFIILAVLAVLAVAGTALAATFNQVHGDRKHGRYDVSSVDSNAIVDSSDYGGPIAIGNLRTVLVSPHLQTASATCKVALALGDMDSGTFKVHAWVETGTMTASATFKASDGYYLAPSVELPLGNWTHFQVVVTALSTGADHVEWSAY